MTKSFIELSGWITVLTLDTDDYYDANADYSKYIAVIVTMQVLLQMAVGLVVTMNTVMIH